MFTEYTSLLAHWRGAHANGSFLLNGLKLLSVYGLGDEVELLAHGLVAVGHADVGYVGATDVVALLPFLVVVWPQPVTLDLEGRL